MKAIVAVVRKMLTAAYFIIKDAVGYKVLGDAYLDQLDKQRASRSPVRRLERVGFDVELHPIA